MRVVVTIADGMVAGVTVDGAGIDALVFLDYDVEGGDAPDTDPEGVPCIVSVHGPEDCKVDPDFVSKVCAQSSVACPNREGGR
jgi:hypothetical protein